MPIIKTVNVGGILNADGTTVTFVSPTRNELITELNIWFHEYFRGLNQSVEPLPPLDDWEHSHEDDTHWSVKFPDEEWLVWTRYEPISFK